MNKVRYSPNRSVANPRAQNVPKTKVERVKLVEITEGRKKDLEAEVGAPLSSRCKTRKHQIQYKIPKLDVAGSTPVAPKILKRQAPIDFTLTVDSTGLKLG